MTPENTIIHCSATPNGKDYTLAQIDEWHQKRGFKRSMRARKLFNYRYKSIGYHFIIPPFDSVKFGRRMTETGAHVRGYNTGSIGICMLGTDKFTQHQWDELHRVLAVIEYMYPNAATDATIKGHRDFSPDLNGDGVITSNEWVKTCPSFDVRQYLRNGRKPQQENILTI